MKFLQAKKYNISNPRNHSVQNITMGCVWFGYDSLQHIRQAVSQTSSLCHINVGLRDAVEISGLM